MKLSWIAVAALAVFACSPAKKTNVSSDKTFLINLLREHKSLDSVLDNRKSLGLQVIYTRIQRSDAGTPSFTDYHLDVDDNRYFYPASTVKLPVAILALQKLNELNIPGLNKDTRMLIGQEANGTAIQPAIGQTGEGTGSVAYDIKQILLVSDNNAFNRLYDFLGQEYINRSLHAMGYKDVQIIHRLSVSMTEEQHRKTDSITFRSTDGNLVYQKPAEISQLKYDLRETKMGKGFMKGEQLINEPFDFTYKNRLPLTTLHNITRSILFPESVAAKQRFNLTPDDYAFLREYMSMSPLESKTPLYTAPEYWDNYVKMIYYGSEKTPRDTNIRIFNKTGTAYGFLIESAYLLDSSNHTEFLVSVIIYCNSDGIFNDDKYDYTNVGYPFLKQLGRVLYERSR